MEEQNVAYTRKFSKTTYALVLKSAENAKGTLEDKLKRIIQKENLNNTKAEEMNTSLA